LKSALDCVVFQLDAGIKQARSDVFNICSGRPRALNPMLALDALRVAASMPSLFVFVNERGTPLGAKRGRFRNG
jgi:hypothetical protein